MLAVMNETVSFSNSTGNQMTRFIPLSLAALLVAGSAFAQSAPTLGERLASGQLTQPAFDNLISGAGVSADEARSMTLNELVTIKWLDLE